jgi:hypothetical protein
MTKLPTRGVIPFAVFVWFGYDLMTVVDTKAWEVREVFLSFVARRQIICVRTLFSFDFTEMNYVVYALRFCFRKLQLVSIS